MKKVVLLTIGFWLAMSVGCYAQENAHLKKMTDDLITLRKSKVSENTCNKVVVAWSAPNCPKITLMDDIGKDENNEYTGKGFNKFKINQIVTDVYSHQNVGMKSRGDFFSSTEKGVFYSVIEKTIKGNGIAKYTLKGHVGTQEIVFVSFNPSAKYTAKVNDKTAQPIEGKPGTCSVKLPNVTKENKIVITIINNSESNESIVILIHNPQK